MASELEAALPAYDLNPMALLDVVSQMLLRQGGNMLERECKWASRLLQVSSYAKLVVSLLKCIIQPGRLRHISPSHLWATTLTDFEQRYVSLAEGPRHEAADREVHPSM